MFFKKEKAQLTKLEKDLKKVKRIKEADPTPTMKTLVHMQSQQLKAINKMLDQQKFILDHCEHMTKYINDMKQMRGMTNEKDFTGNPVADGVRQGRRQQRPDSATATKSEAKPIVDVFN